MLYFIINFGFLYGIASRVDRKYRRTYGCSPYQLRTNHISMSFSSYYGELLSCLDMIYSVGTSLFTLDLVKRYHDLYAVCHESILFGVHMMRKEVVWMYSGGEEELAIAFVVSLPYGRVRKLLTID